MSLEYYSLIHPVETIKQPKVIELPEQITSGMPLLEDAVNITLAQFDVETKDFITAHRLKDYRRKQYTMSLLPEVPVMFDQLLEGGEYWRAKLRA